MSQGNANSFETLSMLSPRNLMRLLSNGIDEIRKFAVETPQALEEHAKEFHSYLSSFQGEYDRYKQQQSKQTVTSTQDAREELQIELKINRIPAQFFTPCETYPLALCKRNEALRRQQELTDYLDEIEVVIFSKTSKYPSRSFIILQNLDDTQRNVDSSLHKLTALKSILHGQLDKAMKKQNRVDNLNCKADRIRQLLKVSTVCKKVRDLKMAAYKEGTSVDGQAQLAIKETLLKISRKELGLCEKVHCLRGIVNNLEEYRSRVKDSISGQFITEMVSIFSRLLCYDKMDWRSINVPANAFGGMEAADQSADITVLDQSYFVFDTVRPNVINSRPVIQVATIREQNEEEDDSLSEGTVDLRKIYSLWEIMKRYELYQPQQINESLIRFFIKHNALFNQDMGEYVTEIYAKAKQGNKQSYADLKKGKYKEEGLSEVPRQVNEDKAAQIQTKMAQIDMKLYSKIVLFYYDMLKRAMQLINSNQKLDFLSGFKEKLHQFLLGRVAYFLDWKKLGEDPRVEDFITQINLIQYWLIEEEYELYEPLQQLKKARVEDQLLRIQKHLLLTEIRNSIDVSTFLPVSVTSESYLIFHLLFSGKWENEDANMSLSVVDIQDREWERESVDRQQEQVQIRFIDTKVQLRGKVYFVCDTFLNLTWYVSKYLQLRSLLDEFTENIDEKVCELVGFYVWYNKKVLGLDKVLGQDKVPRNMRNLCCFLSCLLLLKEMFLGLGITCKKADNIIQQITQCESDLNSQISMIPFLMIEERISQIYESRISTRPTVPTAESLRIVDIIKMAVECLKDYFPLDAFLGLKDYVSSVREYKVHELLLSCVKLLRKNYFGYLLNMDKRGLAELRWFTPKLREILELPIFSRTGQSTANITYLFSEELDEMEKILRGRQK